MEPIKHKLEFLVDHYTANNETRLKWCMLVNYPVKNEK